MLSLLCLPLTSYLLLMVILLSSDDATEYRSTVVVGGLLYLVITGPDISYAVNRVC